MSLRRLTAEQFTIRPNETQQDYLARLIGTTLAALNQVIDEVNGINEYIADTAKL